MKVDGITIEQNIQPRDVTGRRHLTAGSAYAPYYTEVEIGILPKSGNTLARVSLRVPTNSIMQNRHSWHRRLVRFNHFMNVIRSLAKEKYSVKDDEEVVFLRFTGRTFYPDGTPYSEA